MTKLSAERLAEIRKEGGMLNKGGFWIGHAIEDLLSHIAAVEAERDALARVVEKSRCGGMKWCWLIGHVWTRDPRLPRIAGRPRYCCTRCGEIERLES